MLIEKSELIPIRCAEVTTAKMKIESLSSIARTADKSCAIQATAMSQLNSKHGTVSLSHF